MLTSLLSRLPDSPRGADKVPHVDDRIERDEAQVGPPDDRVAHHVDTGLVVLVRPRLAVVRVPDAEPLALGWEGAGGVGVE